MSDIERLTADQARVLLPELVALLQDTVDDGASVGFLRPLSTEIAARYWLEVIRDVAEQSRILLVTRRDGLVVGSVQLGLCTKPNGVHRAEVQKLLVHTGSRRRGIGRKLMVAIEEQARLAQRTLLYLDTEPDKPAHEMYERSGWLRAGEIPDYARTPDGRLHSTILFYRRI
jgi:ribosomal protein S18 acetylase RimI-like enzyme